MGQKVNDHRISNLPRTRDILNGKLSPPPTTEEILAEESKRLGVSLVVKKEDSDG